MICQLEVIRITQYLKDRQKEEGGFSFIPDLYPDIEDTYFAIRTLQLVNYEVDRGKTLNYLKNVDWTHVGFPRTIYMLAYLYIHLNIEFPSPLISLLKMDWLKFQTLDVQFFSDEIQKLLNKPMKLVASPQFFLFSHHENLQALRKKVSILFNHNLDFERIEVIKWVRLCQNGDGGFGFYPGTTSFMENTYCAIEILSKLNSSPMKMDACQEYILNCQTKNGGFGRAPMSFPFIESTYHAVAGWLLLDSMRQKEN